MKEKKTSFKWKGAYLDASLDKKVAITWLVDFRRAR